MTENNFQFSSIEDALADIKAGKMVILADDEDRENEGDLVIAAEKITPEAINFMAKFGRGLICLSLEEKRIKELKLPMMAEDNTSKFGTAFTVSIEAKKGVTTGISAADRAVTILTAINPKSTAEDLARPGHIFPLKARNGGVLERAGQTEGSVDLARLAGLNPAGVICEIMNEDGTMARIPDLQKFAKLHNLKLITIKDLIKYRTKTESFITKIETTKLPTKYGNFDLICYKDNLNNCNHLALVKGDIKNAKSVLVRVHSECLTGDVFHSLRCDCGEQLEASLKLIEKEGRGLLLYMRQEGRGIGLASKLKAYKLQDKGLDTVEANIKLGFGADLRDYGIGAQILVDLGVKNMDLITNNPKKIIGLEGYSLTINKRIPLVINSNVHNERYLKTKQEKLGHLLEI